MARGARYSRTLLGRRSSSFTLILAALLTASVVLPMLLGFGVFSLPVGSDDRAKPDLRPLRSVHEAKDDMGQIGDQWTEVLSWEPRAFIYHKFLVLHYEVGQKYDPHYDSFHDEFNTKNGGQRIATLLMYLISVAQFSC
ncbi:probable prolyl 4-hydroxylase 3 isoform X11 [Musa acuminata AAA Group]|uniref:probable prolyl 4-hydroxylase 3 isoform X11 n=1 Tax=Musa acuminata AAA Group TaxID=214697 RepID=UPI0031DBFD85